jgi:hypothetical protein
MKKFWQSSWGRVIRQIGIYAAGTIPFVGALATVVVKAADAETFRVKTKRAPMLAPAPAPPPPPRAVFDRVTLFQPPPADIGDGIGPYGGGYGPGDFLKPPNLQTASDVKPTVGFYFGLGIVIIIVAVILWRR